MNRLPFIAMTRVDVALLSWGVKHGNALDIRIKTAEEADTSAHIRAMVGLDLEPPVMRSKVIDEDNGRALQAVVKIRHGAPLIRREGVEATIRMSVACALRQSPARDASTFSQFTWRLYNFNNEYAIPLCIVPIRTGSGRDSREAKAG